MDLLKVQELEEFSSENLIKKVPFINEKMRVILLFFDPNQELPLHQHENSHELFYVMEGEGMLMMGEEEHQIEQGNLALAPMGTRHGLKTTQSQMKILAVQAPRP